MKIKGLRWWMIGLVTLGLITNYLTRNVLSVSAAEIMKDIGMTTRQYGYVVSIWQLCYALTQPFAGWLIGILGTKMGFAFFGLAWSLVCVLTSLATSWQGLAFLRGVIGMTEAAGLPVGVKTSTEWFPAKERSVGIGWMNLGAGFGAMLAPPLVAWAILKGDWKFAFIVVGVIGFIWVLLWLIFYRHPSEDKRLTDEEREHILGGQEERYHEKIQEKTESVVSKRTWLHGFSTWKSIFSNSNMWSIVAARILSEPAWSTFNAWIPLYLMTQRGMNIKEIAVFAWLPFLASDLGAVVGGYLSPFYMSFCKVSMETSRKMVMFTGSLCMIGPACIGLVKSPYAAIVLLCFGGFAHQTLSGSLYAITSDSFSKEDVASATGLAGMCGWLGGALFTLLFGIFVTKIGYNPMFVILACFDIVAAIIIWTTVRTYDEIRSR